MENQGLRALREMPCGAKTKDMGLGPWRWERQLEDDREDEEGGSLGEKRGVLGGVSRP